MPQNAQVFLSYSRQNIDFARRLVESLSKNERDVWVDWEDIPRASDWMDEIYSGIDNADTFIFIVSEHSLISEICNQELSHALKNNKRVIPVIFQKVENEVFDRVDAQWKTTKWYPVAQKNWDAVKHLNWLIFDNPETYNSEFEALVQTLDQDLFHIKTHTRLLVRAREWAQKEKNSSSLLAGDDVISAEQWLRNYATTPPKPTQLHQEYILRSREVENEKMARDAKLQAQARQRLQILVASFGIIILLMIFGLLPIIQNWIQTGLGDDTDDRLAEAALSFEELVADDLVFAEIAATFVANSPDLQLLGIDDDFVFGEFQNIKDDFDLQELSLYPADFQRGDDATYYGGPDTATLNERVINERESLILQALDTEAMRSRVIIGSPESQIIAAVPVFRENDNAPWDLIGVVIAANHVNDEYVADIAEILNVEVVLLNLERQVIATTLGDGASAQDDIASYDREIGIFDARDSIYFDYDNLGTGEALRAVNTPFIIPADDNGETVWRDEQIGYLLVARSFEAVLRLQQQLTLIFLVFAGGILGASIALLIVLVGIPAWRNRQAENG